MYSCYSIENNFQNCHLRRNFFAFRLVGAILNLFCCALMNLNRWMSCTSVRHNMWCYLPTIIPLSIPHPRHNSQYRLQTTISSLLRKKSFPTAASKVQIDSSLPTTEKRVHRIVIAAQHRSVAHIMSTTIVYCNSILYYQDSIKCPSFNMGAPC